MSWLSVLIVGFLLGIKHAVEADHVAAVATVAIRSRSLRQALQQGAAWGLGHMLTLSLAAGLLLGTGLPERTAMTLELVVGLMLIGLGIDVLWRLRQEGIHFHEHYHGVELQHFHAHRHDASEVRHDIREHRHGHRAQLPRRALMVGMVHGLAGSAALILLTAHSVSTPWLSFLYIIVFGLGSTLGMSALSVAIMLPVRRSANRLTTVHRGLCIGVGLMSMLLGAFMTFELGIREGLFYTFSLS